MSSINLSKEIDLLRLLCQLQSILSNAINTIELKSVKTLEARYMVWAAVSINQAARGFIVLRQSQEIEASKLLAAQFFFCKMFEHLN
jgi:hypothetical protein